MERALLRCYVLGTNIASIILEEHLHFHAQPARQEQKEDITFM